MKKTKSATNTMSTQRKVRRNLLTASGLALALLLLLFYWTDLTRGYFASLDEAETNKNCFCEVREEQERQTTLMITHKA